MSLKYKVETLADVPEAAKEFYTEKDGGFVLDVEGSTDKGALDAERKARRDADKALSEAKAALGKFEGVDPVKYAEQERKIAELLDTKGGIDLEQLTEEQTKALTEKFMARQTKQMQNEHAAAMSKVQGELDTLTEKYTDEHGRMIENTFVATVTETLLGKVRDECVPDALLHAKNMLTYNEDEGAFFDADNNAADVVLTKLIEDNPRWGKSSTPSGASGSGSGTGTGKAPTGVGDAMGIFS